MAKDLKVCHKLGKTSKTRDSSLNKLRTTKLKTQQMKNKIVVITHFFNNGKMIVKSFILIRSQGQVWIYKRMGYQHHLNFLTVWLSHLIQEYRINIASWKTILSKHLLMKPKAHNLVDQIKWGLLACAKISIKIWIWKSRKLIVKVPKKIAFSVQM